MRSATAIVGCLLLALAGCHAAPQFELAAQQPVRRAADGYAATFDLEVTNRNDFELPLLTINYELWLDGDRVFQGRRSGEATLRRNGTQPLSLPVAFTLGAGEPQPEGQAPYRLRGMVRYHTPGALSRSLFDARLVRPGARFDVRGELDFGPGDGAAGSG